MAASREGPGSLPSVSSAHHEKDSEMVSNSVREDADIEEHGSQSLPQTYLITPTVYTQAAFSEGNITATSIHPTHSLATMPSFVTLAPNVSAAHSLMSQSLYAGNDNNSIVTGVRIPTEVASSYINVTQANMGKETHLPQTASICSEITLSRRTAGQGSDIDQMSIMGNLDVNADSVTQSGLTRAGDYDAVVNLPQTADISGMDLTKRDGHHSIGAQQTEADDCKITILPQTGDISIVDAPHSDEVFRIGVPYTIDNMKQLALPQNSGLRTALLSFDDGNRVVVSDDSQVNRLNLPQAMNIIPSDASFGIDSGPTTMHYSGNTSSVNSHLSEASRLLPKAMTRGIDLSLLETTQRAVNDARGTSIPERIIRDNTALAGDSFCGTTLPQTSAKMSVPYHTEDETALYSEDGIRRMVLPNTGKVVKVSSLTESPVHRVDLSQAHNITGNIHFVAETNSSNLPQTGSTTRTSYIPSTLSQRNLQPNSNAMKISIPCHSDPVGKNELSKSDSFSKKNSHLYSAESSNSTTISQAADSMTAAAISRLKLPQNNDLVKVNTSSTSEVNTISQSTDIQKLLPQADISTQPLDISDMRVVATVYTGSSVRRARLPQTHLVTNSTHKPNELNAETVSLVKTDDLTSVNLPPSKGVSQLQHLQYSALPQTFGTPSTVDVGMASDSVKAVVAQSTSVSTNKAASEVNQPHADDSNIRMMAEAAEILCRSNQQSDDINMRLMAETADYVSRKVQSAQYTPGTVSTVTNRGNLNTADLTTNQPQEQIGLKSVLRPSHVSISSAVSGTALSQFPGGSMISQPSPCIQQELTEPISVAEKEMKVAHRVSAKSRVSEETTKDGDKMSPRKVSEPDQLSSGILTPRDNQQAVDHAYSNTSFFSQEFLNSKSFKLWKNIGDTQGLHGDEEIASFLVCYYDDTCSVFPKGKPQCATCQQQLAVSCPSCQVSRPAGMVTRAKRGDITKATVKEQRPGDISKAERIGEGMMRVRRGGTGKGEQKKETVRTKLWTIIAEASSRSKQRQMEKKSVKMTRPQENVTDGLRRSNRRKPKQTRRVPPRKAKETPQKSYYPSDESAGDNDVIDTTYLPSIHFELQAKTERAEQKTEQQIPTLRKRGRSSNANNSQTTRLECFGCQKKFNSALGLEKHVEFKRCQAPPPSDYEDKKEEKDKEADDHSTPFSSWECSDCKKQYRSKQGLLLHRQSKHGSKTPKLLSENTTEQKTEIKDGASPAKKAKPEGLQCSRCQKKYRSKQGLMVHIISMHSQGTTQQGKTVPEGSGEKKTPVLECSECKKQYSSRPGLMQHLRTKHAPPTLLDCPKCSLKFKTRVEMRIHIRREHNQGQLVLFCPYCPLIFHQRDVLRAHMAENHKTCRQVLYDCFGCELQFSSLVERKRHIQSEHKGKDTSLTCHFCGGWFATRLEYTQHEKEGHPEETQSWLCATCGGSFPTRYLLQRHALSHKEKIICDICNKSVTEPCYEDHMKRHLGNKAWQCKECPKSFIRKAELHQHMLVHRDERPFCCELCGMRYREKSRLNSHMRTHSGVKPYKCEQCEKSFTRSRELKNHMRVHTGEKPFCCSVCGRKFASSGNLSAHRRKVHKLEPIPHGQQSRRHMLEEISKVGSAEYSQPFPLVLSMARGAAVVHDAEQVVPTVHVTAVQMPVAHAMVHNAPQAYTSGLMALTVTSESIMALNGTAAEMPIALTATTTTDAPLALTAAPETPMTVMSKTPEALTVISESPMSVVKTPAGHSADLEAPVVSQAPVAHQTPAAQQYVDASRVRFQQHLVAKYEPMGTVAESYIAQPVVQPSPSAMPPIYWPNTS